MKFDAPHLAKLRLDFTHQEFVGQDPRSPNIHAFSARETLIFLVLFWLTLARAVQSLRRHVFCTKKLVTWIQTYNMFLRMQHKHLGLCYTVWSSGKDGALVTSPHVFSNYHPRERFNWLLCAMVKFFRLIHCLPEHRYHACVHMLNVVLWVNDNKLIFKMTCFVSCSNIEISKKKISSNQNCSHSIPQATLIQQLVSKPKPKSESCWHKVWERCMSLTLSSYSKDKSWIHTKGSAAGYSPLLRQVNCKAKVTQLQAIWWCEQDVLRLQYSKDLSKVCRLVWTL